MKRALCSLLVWFILCGCTFAKEGYRVWIGDNHATDWIDVVSEQKYLNGEFIETFRDDSPIQHVSLLVLPGCQWLLDKAHSSWLLRSTDGQVIHYTLERLTPFERTFWDQYRAAKQPTF